MRTASPGPCAVCFIEAGRYNPSLKLCTAICKTLGKTLDELFWEAGE